MTDTASAAVVAGRPSGYLRPLRAAGEFVHRRVTALQQGHLADSPTAAAQLAQLRRAVGRDVGSVVEAWEVTLRGVPVPANAGDEPTRVELAVHEALTLYALHQQSRREPMYQRGPSLGLAVQRLADEGAAAAVERRFHAVGTATGLAEASHHLRGLVTQLRGRGIPLDYAQLADDFVDLQTPTRAARVRLRWGRDFYRVQQERPNDDITQSQPTTGEE